MIAALYTYLCCLCYPSFLDYYPLNVVICQSGALHASSLTLCLCGARWTLELLQGKREVFPFTHPFQMLEETSQEEIDDLADQLQAAQDKIQDLERQIAALQRNPGGGGGRRVPSLCIAAIH